MVQYWPIRARKKRLPDDFANNWSWLTNSQKIGLFRKSGVSGPFLTQNPPTKYQNLIEYSYNIGVC